MVAFLAHDERAVCCKHDVDGSVELGSMRGTVLLASSAIPGDGRDFAGGTDGPDAVVISIGDVDDPVRSDAEPRRIVKPGLEWLAIRESALSVARDCRDCPVALDAP